MATRVKRIPSIVATTSPIVTDWQSYVPTFTGMGTVTVSSLQWRQVGSNVEIRGTWTTGTVTAVEARISLPNSYSSSSSVGTLELAGNFGRGATVAAITERILIEASVTYMTFGIQSAAAVALSKGTGTAAFASATAYSLQASFPISGLSPTQTISQQIG